MDGRQLDDVVRQLGEKKLSRSRVVGMLLGGGAAFLSFGSVSQIADARHRHKRGGAVSAAYANIVNYRGQGLLSDGFGGWDLITELCGVDNGADADGPYLLWVLTATGASNANITGPWGTAEMAKFGSGTFKFVSDWYEPLSLPGAVSASYDGKKKNVQLTISHGCRPYKQGAWCSPGYWRNADDAAWTLIGISKSDLFNITVVPDFYDTTFLADPNLGTTLADNAYKKGTLTSAPFGLTPFNATGAFLTNNIPGFQCDYALFLEAQAAGETTYMCPIDSHGNFKE